MRCQIKQRNLDQKFEVDFLKINIEKEKFIIEVEGNSVLLRVQRVINY